jgi:hypothetical protein
MATPNQPTSPGSGPTQQEAKDQLASLKEILKLQGDYRDILRDSVRELQATLKSYDKMEAKLATINRSAINIKDVEKQIKQTVESEYINSKKRSDLETKLSETQKNAVTSYLGALNNRVQIEKDLLNAQKTGNVGAARHYENMLKANQSRIDQEESLLNIDQLAYAQSVKTSELNKEILDKQKAQLDTEKQIKSEVGYSGAALGLFAKKLGLGNQAYEEMVEKARKLNEEGKKLTFGDKLGALGKAATGGLKEALTDPLTMIPVIGTALGGIVKGFMQIVELGLEVQDRTTKFGRAVGLSKEEAQGVVNNFQKISLNSNSSLVTIQRLVESQKELTDELGVNNILSNEILETNVKLKELAGLDAQTRAEIAKSSVITGQSSEGITKSVLSQITGLKAATGISFNYQKILKEASNLGGYLGLSFSKYPAQLSKSLVTVKSMGLELKQLESMADSFLDFESSISKEFEAQLLTGKDINLTKAREAFLNNDLATAAKEITSQVGSAQDFLKLNRIQAESLASAFGMSRDQMGEMLKQQEMLSKLGAKDLKDAQAKVEALKAQGKSKQEIARITGEEAYQSLVNASAQEKIAGFMDKIKEAIGNFIANSPLMPLIDRAIDYLSKPSNIKAIVTSIQGAFATIFDIVGNVAAAIMKVANFFGAGIDKDVIAIAKSGGDNIRAMKFDMPQTVSDNAARERKGSTMTTNDNQYGGSRLAKPQTVVIQNKVTAVMDQKQLNRAEESASITFDQQTG